MELTHTIINKMDFKTHETILNVFNSDIFLLILTICIFILGEYFLIKYLQLQDESTEFYEFFGYNIIMVLPVWIIIMVYSLIASMMTLKTLQTLLIVLLIGIFVVGIKYVLFEIFLKRRGKNAL